MRKDWDRVVICRATQCLATAFLLVSLMPALSRAEDTNLSDVDVEVEELPAPVGIFDVLRGKTAGHAKCEIRAHGPWWSFVTGPDGLQRIGVDFDWPCLTCNSMAAAPGQGGVCLVVLGDCPLDAIRSETCPCVPSGVCTASATAEECLTTADSEGGQVCAATEACDDDEDCCCRDRCRGASRAVCGEVSHCEAVSCDEEIHEFCAQTCQSRGECSLACSDADNRPCGTDVEDCSDECQGEDLAISDLTPQKLLQVILDLHESIMEARVEHLEDLAEVHIEKAKLEARLELQSLRDEQTSEMRALIDENARLRAEVELASQRERMMRETLELTMENERLKLRVAELERGHGEDSRERLSRRPSDPR